MSLKNQTEVLQTEWGKLTKFIMTTKARHSDKYEPNLSWETKMRPYQKDKTKWTLSIIKQSYHESYGTGYCKTKNKPNLSQ